nr:hypothetical protein [Sphingomonas sp. Y57]
MSTGRDRHGHHLPAGLCWLIAMAITVASLRLFLWLLDSAGVIGAEESNRMMLVALPVMLLTLGCLAPTGEEEK